MALSPLRPDPTTRLATSLLSHRLGTHLVADEHTTEGYTSDLRSETVLYEMLTGQLRVRLTTGRDGTLTGVGGTIAEVRVVEGLSGGLSALADSVEVGCPRISIVRSETQPVDRYDRLGFDLQVSSGTVAPQHAEGFVVALEVAAALAQRLAEIA